MAAVLLLALANCGEAPEEGERMAFLAADNQTGDGSLEWAARVVNRGMSAAVGSSIAVDTIADARMAQAGVNRVVYSTLTRAPDGEVRLHSAIFDNSTQQFNREFTVTGNILQVVNRMATSINPEPHALGAKSEEALRKWPVLSGGDVQSYETQCQQLAQAEPGFGAALGSCAEQLAASGRVDGLREFLSRIPTEQWRDFSAEALDSIGKGYMALKDYPNAAKVYRAGSAAAPRLKNLVGYAEALGGHCDAARLALEEYGRIPGEEPNALDSLGETSFFCGKFKEAEKYFAAAEGKLQATPQGLLEPIKAAAARSMTGDAAGANQAANQYLDKLGKTNGKAAAALKPAWSAIAAAGSMADRQAIIEKMLIRRP